MNRETILCVDDERGVLDVLRDQLAERFGDECEIAVAQSGADALELITELRAEGEQLAVVIADQIMPGMKGVDVLEEVHRRSPATGKILLTGQAGLAAVVSAINRAELNHYIAKPWDEANLRLAVENLLRQYRQAMESQRHVQDLTAKNEALLQLNHELEAKIAERTHDLEEAQTRLSQLAVTDGLTGLYNHRHFHERLSLEVERSVRNGLPISLCLIDIDRFKEYNNNHGHPAGDALLCELAELFGERRRANDFVARYGGEEFGMVLVDTAKHTAHQVAERLRNRVESETGVTVSVGVAGFPEDAQDADALIRAADAALRAAKNGGRNTVALAQELA